MIRELRYILAVLIGVSMMVSCADEPIIQGSGDIPEGYATISAKVSFKPFGSALNGGSRTAGDAIKEIESLYILLYDENEQLKEVFNAGEKNDQGGYKYNYSYEEEESREDVQSGNGEHIAEQKTPCAKFKKTIPYGKYYIYAVANYDLTDKDYSTIDKLRNLQLTWNDDVATNNEMFGYFTNGKTSVKPNGWNAPVVTITSPNVELHAWIRRAASKVTIAYDGESLNDNVYITIKSVQIKDIPKNCKLGVDYAVQSEEGLIADGEIIRYTTSDTDNNGPIITNGGVNWNSIHIEGWENPYDPKGTDGVAHTETSEALFFYENLQGIGETKVQEDKNEDGFVDDKDQQKDNKPLGTYIEVKGYYENRNLESVSKGDIIYRFMLGKNITDDYNAERNYHYKLTLKFKGDANDVDWHIDYDEELGIYVPDVYYISYLYNQQMELPLKVVFDNDDEMSWFQTEIVENNWEPDGDASALGDNYYGNGTGDKNSIYSAMGSNGVVSGTIGAGNTNVRWLGFLTLRDELKMNGDTIYRKAFDGDISVYAASTLPYEWWINPNGVADSIQESRGDYVANNVEDGNDETKTYAYKIRLYTRLKQLYITSGFTGNNPYVGYNRKAKVKFTAHLKSTPNPTERSPYVKYVDIVQVKRLINPTGIWRDKNNAESFNVVLKEQDGYGGDFTDLISQGSWSAEIMKFPQGDGEWFDITPKSGVTGSRVAFTYRPNGTTDKPRCGIIKVTYHNNTCSHLIFVRQGYDPIALEDGLRKWYSFNLKTKDAMTTSPLDEGSLYRYGTFDKPISEINNLNLGLGIAPGDKEFVLEGIYNDDGTNKSLSWSDIGSLQMGASFDSPVSGAVFPGLDDWNALQKLKQGYGVLYADGATECATSTMNAFGYRDAYPGGDKNKRGMRGVFVYSEKTGRNLFFPIGALGYGHRKHAYTDYPGILRYGTRETVLNDSYQEYHPMLWGLFKQYGAIYWTADLGKAWDINFDQLDFNTYGTNAWKDYEDGNGKQSDACFVRLIKYE